MKTFLKKSLGPSTFWKLKNWAYINFSRDFKKRKRFYSLLLGNNDLCFDVGANVGNRTAVFKSLGAEVVAVEPLPICREILKAKFSDSVQIVPKALGHEVGEKHFYEGSISTLSTLSADWINEVKKDRFKTVEWAKKEAVQVTTLDNLIQKFGKPSFIKIDVEGYELEVLKGLSGTVNALSFEYTVPEQNEELEGCIHRLISLGQVEFNYSVGESMVFSLANWVSANQMGKIVKTIEFGKTGFGDIYCRQVSE